MTNGNKLVTGIIAGAPIGTVDGLSFTPKPGEEARRTVTTRAVEFRQEAGG